MVEGSRILREKQCEITPGRLLGGGKRAKAEIADYVLVYRNTKLATIEAKALNKPYTEGVGQAKSYATNGQKIYGIDMATGVTKFGPTHCVGKISRIRFALNWAAISRPTSPALAIHTLLRIIRQ